MLLFRALFFALLIPGMIVGVLPYLIGSSAASRSVGDAFDLVALALIAAGVTVLGWCIADFLREGQGTLAPVDPPTRLVQAGLYRHVRNPMYLGALLVLLGQTLIFRTAALAAYSAVWFACVNVFVVCHEEPTLRRTFGAAYDAYCRTTGRWVPR
jgi:protein-S-isoprenylcysteine O-methyltransferase Ste14